MDNKLYAVSSKYLFSLQMCELFIGIILSVNVPGLAVIQMIVLQYRDRGLFVEQKGYYLRNSYYDSQF